MRLTAILACLSLAACHTSTGGGEPASTPPAPGYGSLETMPEGFPAAELSQCDTRGQPGTPIFWFDRPSVAAGTPVALEPQWVVGSHLWYPVEVGCLRSLQVSPASASLEWRDGQLWLTPAPEGETTIEGTWAMKTIKGAVLAYDAAANPLVGRWSQRREDCPGGGRVGELVFRADGSMSLTYQPFERYVDYWGGYEYDAASGTLSVNPTGGNFVPGDIAAGSVTVEGDALTLDGASLGSTSAGQRCTAAFVRAG